MRRSAFIATIISIMTQTQAREIPFPEALDAAAIEVQKLDSLLDESLILGNGDINALLYSDGGHLCLRLTKNDVWDARLDSKLDPPIPTLARIKELARGTWPERNWILPEGSTWKGPDSYHAHPYPCPRACGVVRLGTEPATPSWRCIRSQGSHNAWERRGDATVMSIEGRKEASNGWAFGPLDLPMDEYPTLRVKLSGTENARFYVDILDTEGRDIFGHEWMETPTESEERTFELPRGQRAGRLILYTWTEDGKRAENRFESVTFEGPGNTFAPDLTLAAPPPCPARLDIRRATAHVSGSTAGIPRATVRALADHNVFLIQTSANATLVPIRAPDLPVTTGEQDNVTWLKQDISGDTDWPGMKFAVAVATYGDRTAISIVTSRESDDVVVDAVKLATETLRADNAALVRGHETSWQKFWVTSGVDLDDALLSASWYQNLYFLRCVTKPGVVAPGLFASLVNDRPAWHGDYHTNYNIQQTFWTCFNANHPELAEPYDDLIVSYFARARWLARTVFDSDGAYYPHVLFAYEPPPEQCHGPTRRQYLHHVWGFTIGVAGFTVQPLWWHYKYAPNREFLEKVAYPAVRDVAIFYADFVDECDGGPNGKVVLAPSVSPEHWGWTPNFERNRNCAFDIALARYTLEAAIEGATTLDRDAHLVRRFRAAVVRLPAYPTTEDEEAIVVDVEGAPAINYNIAVPATPVFPGDVVTWWSPAEQRELFARTTEGLRWNGNNSMVILAVTRARLSMPGTLKWLHDEVTARLRPNRTVTLNRLGLPYNRAGHYTEQFATTMAVGELLLQSVGDIIRVFPAWPKDRPARFHDLRAQGGFLVSGELRDGEVTQVSVTSTAGGRLRLLSPWPRISVRRGPHGDAADLEPDASGTVTLETHAGEGLVFAGSD